MGVETCSPGEGRALVLLRYHGALASLGAHGGRFILLKMFAIASLP